MQLAYRRFSENRPGSQPQEMSAQVRALRAAASTFAKCVGMLACVSNESTTLYSAAYFGVCSGRSVALPPHRMSTSMSSLPVSRSATERTGTPSVAMLTLAGSRRVYTAASSMSSFWRMASSTPRPRFPYPKMPMRVISLPFPMRRRRAAIVPEKRFHDTRIMRQTRKRRAISAYQPYRETPAKPRLQRGGEHSLAASRQTSGERPRMARRQACAQHNGDAPSATPRPILAQHRRGADRPGYILPVSFPSC